MLGLLCLSAVRLVCRKWPHINIMASNEATQVLLRASGKISPLSCIHMPSFCYEGHCKIIDIRWSKKIIMPGSEPEGHSMTFAISKTYELTMTLVKKKSVSQSTTQQKNCKNDSACKFKFWSFILRTNYWKSLLFSANDR